jgi:cell division protein FtsB
MAWFEVLLIRFFSRPKEVAVICTVLLALGLVVDGALWNIWNLSGEMKRLRSDLVVLKQEMSSVDQSIKQAQQPEFVAREARQRLDMISRDELVFVFSSEDAP